MGWELYIPTECAPGVFDVLMEAGKAFDLKLCGYHALNSLRMEKGYRHWGHDISDEDTPLQGGLGFAVALHPLLLLHGFARLAPDLLAGLQAARSTTALADRLMDLGQINEVVGLAGDLSEAERHGG